MLLYSSPVCWYSASATAVIPFSVSYIAFSGREADNFVKYWSVHVCPVVFTTSMGSTLFPISCFPDRNCLCKQVVCLLMNLRFSMPFAICIMFWRGCCGFLPRNAVVTAPIALVKYLQTLSRSVHTQHDDLAGWAPRCDIISYPQENERWGKIFSPN